MILLGITGAIGSGKTTLADMLLKLEPQHAYFETGSIIAEAANTFNQALDEELRAQPHANDIQAVNQALIPFVGRASHLLHAPITWNQLAISAKDQVSHPELYAKLSQYLRIIREHPAMLRHPITTSNKEQYRPILQWLGGYLIAKVSPTLWMDEIFRRIDLHEADKNLVIITGIRYPAQALAVQQQGGQIITITRPIEETDATDITEASRSQIAANATVMNDGDLAQLQVLAEKLYYDASIGKLAKRYTAA